MDLWLSGCATVSFWCSYVRVELEGIVPEWGFKWSKCMIFCVCLATLLLLDPVGDIWKLFYNFKKAGPRMIKFTWCAFLGNRWVQPDKISQRVRFAIHFLIIECLLPLMVCRGMVSNQIKSCEQAGLQLWCISTGGWWDWLWICARRSVHDIHWELCLALKHEVKWSVACGWLHTCTLLL